MHAEFNRGTREWGITAYDWNPSVSTETPEEAARRREAHTQHCQSATQRATLRMMQRNYKGPVAAQVQRMEDMRQQVGAKFLLARDAKMLLLFL